MKKYYVVKVEFGSPRMAIVWSDRETDKTVFVSKSETLFGYLYIGSRVQKDSGQVFESGQKAIEYLIQEMSGVLNNNIRDLNQTKQYLYDLDKLLSGEFNESDKFHK